MRGQPEAPKLSAALNSLWSNIDFKRSKKFRLVNVEVKVKIALVLTICVFKVAQFGPG